MDSIRGHLNCATHNTQALHNSWCFKNLTEEDDNTTLHRSIFKPNQLVWRLIHTFFQKYFITILNKCGCNPYAIGANDHFMDGCVNSHTNYNSNRWRRLIFMWIKAFKLFQPLSIILCTCCLTILRFKYDLLCVCNETRLCFNKPTKFVVKLK